MKCFRCSRTGMLFPSNYIEDWGRLYGIGLGPTPVSEALVNDYHRKPVTDGDPIMHPLSVCRAQVDFVEVSDDEYAANSAILAIDDPRMSTRTGAMFARQIRKSAALRNLLPAAALAADREDEIAAEKVVKLSTTNKK